MKKKIFISFLLILTILCIILIILKLDTFKTNTNENTIYDELNSVTYTNFDEYIFREQPTYIYIGRSDCSDCVSFEPQFLKYLEETNLNSKITYLNIEKVHSDNKKWEVFKNKYDIQYTPTVAKFENGKLKSKVEWTPEKGISINMISEWIDTNVD